MIFQEIRRHTHRNVGSGIDESSRYVLHRPPSPPTAAGRPILSGQYTRRLRYREWYTVVTGRKLNRRRMRRLFKRKVINSFFVTAKL
jgi:hypothetical protein